MIDKPEGYREGSLEAPTRHPIGWKDAAFHDEAALNRELERVFDICHGCRRCVSLCNAFPTLFDLVDQSATMEVNGVAKSDYRKVVDQCYLCDLCYQTKCPYVPPHEWNVDFPHLMLRAKAVRHRQGKSSLRDRALAATDTVGNLAGIPLVAGVVNAVNRNGVARKVMEATLGVHRDAVVPEYHSDSLRKRMARRPGAEIRPEPTGETRGRIALFVSCYGNRCAPDSTEDLVRVLAHNNVPVTLTGREQCCGMPKMELGDLDAVERARNVNVPELARLVDAGHDLTAPIPSCVLMFRQELPLLFPGDADVQKVARAFFDPFEYLMLRHKSGKLRTEFRNRLGKIAYHVPCHQRVQKIGLKTREVLKLVPGTTFEIIERCSGHDGTYAVKKEYHDISMKICRPVVDRVRGAKADHYVSDCPMAGVQIQSGVRDGSRAESPFSLLRHAYGI
ncbi:MAG: Fe-S oxidoreductase [Gammaproteobacteria bacterium]|nr:Fe-S oxidoreductase [Gammaproteobacteria bacterium]